MGFYVADYVRGRNKLESKCLQCGKVEDYGQISGWIFICDECWEEYT